MKNVLVLFVCLVVPLAVFAASDARCSLAEKKSCSVEAQCLAQAQAGPYTVMLCKGAMEKGEKKEDNETMFCIKDSAGEMVKVKNVSATVGGKSAKVEKEKCGYELKSAAQAGDIVVAFTVGKEKYSATLVAQAATQPAVEQNVAPAPVAPKTPVNTICPVMGGKVNPKYTVEYKGKLIGFCCGACPPEFNKDPEKYMKKLK